MQGLFYTGLFIAGLTSSFGVLTGAPRVMQGLGEDVKVPGIEQFAVTFGSKEEPLRGLFASAIISGCMLWALLVSFATTTSGIDDWLSVSVRSLSDVARTPNRPR